MESVLFEHPHLSVINRDNYIFTHTRNSVVYVLPYRSPKRDAYLLGRFEVCPAHSQRIELYAITGQCEAKADPRLTALEELYEEAGISALPSQVVSLGSG